MSAFETPAGRPVEFFVGQRAEWVKTVTADDLGDFARLTGDDHPNHTDHDYAVARGFGGRVAQGSLLVGLLAGASCRFLERTQCPAVSYGYDKVRFLKPVRIGDRLTVVFVIEGCDPAKNNAFGHGEIRNQDGALVAVGVNILHFPRGSPPSPS